MLVVAPSAHYLQSKFFISLTTPYAYTTLACLSRLPALIVTARQSPNYRFFATGLGFASSPDTPCIMTFVG